MSDYNYDRYDEIIRLLLDTMWRDPDDLEIGEDISDIPSVKIIFDGYGDLEITDEDGEYVDTEEGGNKAMESYAIFIHRDSGKEGFVFPPHELTPWALIHRPKEEICIYAWYDVEMDSWSFIGLEELSENELGDDEVMTILEAIHSQWFQST
jgi:hypothetical protein